MTNQVNNHLPDSTTQLREYNVIEVFDLAEDPSETTNLAAEGTDHDSLIAKLNEKMNRLSQQEIGAAENGSYLLNVTGSEWSVTEIKNVQHPPYPTSCAAQQTWFGHRRCR